MTNPTISLILKAWFWSACSFSCVCFFISSSFSTERVGGISVCRHSVIRRRVSFIRSRLRRRSSLFSLSLRIMSWMHPNVPIMVMLNRNLLCRSAALLPLSPLRTVRAIFTAYSSDNSKFNSPLIPQHFDLTLFISS